MSALEPGFYKATIFGKERVGLVDRDGDFTYNNAVGESVQTPVSPRRVEDNLRPLIVLDLDAYDTGKFLKFLKEKCDDIGGPWYRASADAVRQIEEQTKPARIPEPGLWGVVRAEWAAVTSEWVRRSNGWQSWGGTITEWDDLIEPALIREGVN